VRGFSRSRGNSGIQFRSRYGREAGWMDGPQVDVHPPAPWRTGLLYDETREVRRWIFPSLPDFRIEPGQGPREWLRRQAGEGEGWNDVQLTCRGMHVTTVVNGVTIADFDGRGATSPSSSTRTTSSSSSTGTSGSASSTDGGAFLEPKQDAKPVLDRRHRVALDRSPALD